jgi:hypothetical protein
MYPKIQEDSLFWVREAPLLAPKKATSLIFGQVLNHPDRGGVIKMNNTCCDTRGYVLAAVLGAIGGGLLVALATKAVPRMISKMMSGMMENMMGQMEKSGCNPAEMCEKMMKRFGEAGPEETLSE